MGLVILHFFCFKAVHTTGALFYNFIFTFSKELFMAHLLKKIAMHNFSRLRYIKNKQFHALSFESKIRIGSLSQAEI